MQNHFQNVTLVGMVSRISKKLAYKCVDHSRHNYSVSRGSQSYADKSYSTHLVMAPLCLLGLEQSTHHCYGHQ